jgi:hypothetical protein
VDRNGRAPVVASLVDHLALIGFKRPAGAEWSDSLVFEVARDGMCRAEARIRARPLLPEAAAGDRIRRLMVWEVDQLHVEPAGPHKY